MSAPIVAFFNNKGGVGKTTLVYHLAWMFSELGYKTLALDLDPQANLTAAFLSEDDLETIWEDDEILTIEGTVRPLRDRTGDIASPELLRQSENLFLLPGSLSLTRFEDTLAENWSKCLGGDPGAFRVTTAFWRIARKCVRNLSIDIVLVDLGPNLGAINRSALIGSDFVVVPLSPDLYSLQGLKNLGPTFVSWRKAWGKMKDAARESDIGFELPTGAMNPLGYIVLQHSVRLDRPAKYYDQWAQRIPEVYAEAVLAKEKFTVSSVISEHELARLKHYRSLMPMSQEARKPIFYLRSADGAIGAHLTAVQEVKREFKLLAKKIASRASVQADK